MSLLSTDGGAAECFVVGQKVDVCDWDGAWLVGLVVVVDEFFGGDGGAIVVSFVDRMAIELTAHFVLPFDRARLALAGTHTRREADRSTSDAPPLKDASPRVESSAAHDTWVAMLRPGAACDIRDFDGIWHRGEVTDAGSASSSTASASATVPTGMLSTLPPPAARTVRVAFRDSFARRQVATIYIDLFHDGGRLAIPGSRSGVTAALAAAPASPSLSPRSPQRVAEGRAVGSIYDVDASSAAVPPAALGASTSTTSPRSGSRRRRASPPDGHAAGAFCAALAPGSSVECRDFDGVWYESTVIATDEQGDETEQFTHIRLRFVDRFGFDQQLSLYLPFDRQKLRPLLAERAER